jgi:hypothetical protein
VITEKQVLDALRTMILWSEQNNFEARVRFYTGEFQSYLRAVRKQQDEFEGTVTKNS